MPVRNTDVHYSVQVRLTGKSQEAPIIVKLFKLPRYWIISVRYQQWNVLKRE